MMKIASRGLAALSVLLVAVLLLPSTAFAALERVGPNDPVNGFPQWYQDKTGVAFEFCAPLTQAELDGGHCLLLPADVPIVPEVFPTSFFDEHFFWAADALGDWSLNGVPGSRAVLVLALEAAFSADVAPGNQIMFGRLRIRIDDLPLSGTYTVYTPYGVYTFPNQVAGERLFFTDDTGIACPPGQFDCALQSAIGPFLLPSATPGGAEIAPVAGPVPGKLYIADPGRDAPVTGSPIVGDYQTSSGPRNPNIFRVEGPGGVLLFETFNFTLMGRLYTDVIPGRVAVDRASYARSAAGAVKVDVYATGEPTTVTRLPASPLAPPVQPVLAFYNAPCGGVASPFTAPAGVPAIPMSRNGNLYYGQGLPAAVPAAVCLADTNARNANNVVVPTYIPGVLGDQIFITDAIYSKLDGGSLTVRATSADDFGQPALSLGAFGELADNVAFANGVAVVAPLAAPPSKVRVLSAENGSNEMQVATGTRPATGVTLTASVPSPQAPGTAVVFTAAGQGLAGYQYRFWLDSGTGPIMVQDYGVGSTWTLPGTTPVGTYRVIVHVRTSNAVAFDARAEVAYTVVSPATGVTLTASVPSPAVKGTPVVFTAAGQGSSGYQYRFFIDSGAGPGMVRDYSTNPSFTMPGTTPAGTYKVIVHARTSPAVAFEARAELSYTIRELRPRA